MIEWFAYIHENTTLQVKRFFDERDIEDAYESPFCIKVFESFYADSRQDAINKITPEYEQWLASYKHAKMFNKI